MEARIGLELRGKKPSEVKELLLDNCKASKISGLSDEYTSLNTISLINVGLTTLEGLPKLESLRTIDLSDNKLSGGLDKLVENCPRLYHINLCANNISEFTALEPLTKLEELTALDLFDCEVTEKPDYRKKVFEMMPQLQYLDGFDVNDIEANISEDGDAFPGEDLSDEDGADETGDDENGLSYLDSSKALQDEDESEDFIENGNGVKTNGKTGASATSQSRGTKRKHEGEDDEEEEDSDDEAAAAKE